MTQRTILAVALLVVCAAGCVPRYTGNPHGPKVAIIGDSITAQATDELHAALDDTYHVSVSGAPGQTVAERQPAAQAYAEGKAGGIPDVVVVNLGTNDAWRAAWGSGDTPWTTALGLYVMALRFPGACFIQTTLTTSSPWPVVNAFHAQVNAGMANTRHVPWAETVALSPARMVADGLHPTANGRGYLAALTREQVDACPGRTTP